MRTRALFAAVFLLFVLGAPPSAGAKPLSSPAHKSAVLAQAATQNGPSVAASSAILIDADGGRVLYEKNAGQKRAIASITKIVTAVVVMQETNPTDVVTASSRAEAIGADDPLVTELELVAGERLTVEHLLYGLLLPSANDAAVALAEHVAGSVEKFAVLMNEAVDHTGAGRSNGSNFTNPHGLDDPNHYSTASDLAHMARVFMGFPLLREIAATRTYTIPREGKPATELVNRNQLLGTYSGTTGLKTGQTRASGKSLVASANRGGEERIAVVLDSPDTFAEARVILDFGFNAFKRFRLAAKDRVWGFATYGDGTTVALVPRETASVLLDSSAAEPEVTFDAKRRMVRTVDGQHLGAPVTFRCSLRCQPRDQEPSVVGLIWRVFAPAAEAIRN